MTLVKHLLLPLLLVYALLEFGLSSASSEATRHQFYLPSLSLSLLAN
jgi:hypothetical protein